MMNRIAPRAYLALFFLLSVTALSAGCTEPAPGDTLVVSIQPLALITREIAGDDFPIIVLAGDSDPHHYAPTVADRAQLETAALVIWMGPQLEPLLARQLQQSRQRKLQLITAAAYKYAGTSPRDPHLWLRPHNAALMAAVIARHLAELKPQHAHRYRQRAQDFSNRIGQLQRELKRVLGAYKAIPVVTRHAAYGHFFGGAGITPHSLGNTESDPHGAKTLLQLPVKTAGCFFGDVPRNNRDRQIAGHLDMRYQALDPLGQQLPKDGTYQQLIEQLLADSRSCFASEPGQNPPED